MVFLCNFITLAETGDQEMQRKKYFGMKSHKTIP